MPTLNDDVTPLEDQSQAALCQIDLLQVIGILSSDYGPGPTARAALWVELNFRERGRVVQFAGAEQAVTFLHSFRFSEELAEQLLVSSVSHALPNPFPEELLLLKRAIAAQFLMDEGGHYDCSYPYVLTEGYLVALAAALRSVMRICDYQSAVATQLAEYFVSPRVRPMQVAAPRFTTPTLGAYYSRAAAIAGFERSSYARWHSAYDPTKEPISSELRWTINSKHLVEAARQPERLVEAGYPPRLAEDLVYSGLYAIPATDYVGHHLAAFALDGVEPGIFYSSDIGEFDMATKSHVNNRFLLIDSYYQRIWPVMGIRPVAAYGGSSELPPNRFVACLEVGEDEQSGRKMQLPEIVGFSRAEHSLIPRVIVHEPGELLGLVERIQRTLDETGEPRKLFFRGQTRGYSIARSAGIFRFLYGASSEDEVSLLTTASREQFDYDHFYSYFQLQLQAILYARAGVDAFRLDPSYSLPVNCPFLDQRLQETYAKWCRAYGTFTWETIVMALAQHYGVPSHGLDLTEDLDVAIWFALSARDGTVEEKSAGRPVVYMIASDADLKFQFDRINELGFEALRPVRQRAALHFGGWGLHSNICAQEVVAIAELGESFVPSRLLTRDYLFPGPDQDRFLWDLLELKKRALAQGITFGYSYVK